MCQVCPKGPPWCIPRCIPRISPSAATYRCASSSRSWSRRFKTQDFVVPSSRATSAAEKPSEIGAAINLRVASARSDSCSQVIVVGIVEADELGERPFVDVVGELPAGAAVVFPLPVEDPFPQGDAGVGGEADSAGLEAQGEFPAGFDEVDQQVVVFVWAKFEPSISDAAAEPLYVPDVVQGEGAIQHSGHHFAWPDRKCFSG